MNSCVLMAEVIKSPELRYTQDGQTPISEMLVQFPGLRAEDPPETLKVIGWGNLAQQIQERFHPGDRVVIEGRLNMNTLDRPEGFKEKRAELTAVRIHSVGADADFGSTVSGDNLSARPVPSDSAAMAVSKANKAEKAPPVETVQSSYDDIPF